MPVLVTLFVDKKQIPRSIISPSGARDEVVVVSTLKMSSIMLLFHSETPFCGGVPTLGLIKTFEFLCHK